MDNTYGNDSISSKKIIENEVIFYRSLHSLPVSIKNLLLFDSPFMISPTHAKEMVEMFGEETALIELKRFLRLSAFETYGPNYPYDKPQTKKPPSPFDIFTNH